MLEAAITVLECGAHLDDEDHPRGAERTGRAAGRQERHPDVACAHRRRRQGGHPGGAVEICRILGRDETLRRLRAGLEKLA